MADSSGAVLQVEVVSADRLVWSGEATMVIARTTEGDVGILPNHAPMLSRSQLLAGQVVDRVKKRKEPPCRQQQNRSEISRSMSFAHSSPVS